MSKCIPGKSMKTRIETLRKRDLHIYAKVHSGEIHENKD